MLKSKTIKIRLVEEFDAEFIISLRTNGKYNKYLSSVDDNVEAQKEWIKSYKKEEVEGKQFYFIIEKLDGTPCGTVRVYDLREDSFCWGSWILNQSKTRYSALESAFLVYDFGFNKLGYSKSHFEVVKGNDKVVDFHLKFGAHEIGGDESHLYFEITKESVEKTKNKFAKVFK